MVLQAYIEKQQVNSDLSEDVVIEDKKPNGVHLEN
jgi:hypothetical protein